MCVGLTSNSGAYLAVNFGVNMPCKAFVSVQSGVFLRVRLVFMPETVFSVFVHKELTHRNLRGRGYVSVWFSIPQAL